MKTNIPEDSVLWSLLKQYRVAYPGYSIALLEDEEGVFWRFPVPGEYLRD